MTSSRPRFLGFARSNPHHNPHPHPNPCFYPRLSLCSPPHPRSHSSPPSDHRLGSLNIHESVDGSRLVVDVLMATLGGAGGSPAEWIQLQTSVDIPAQELEGMVQIGMDILVVLKYTSRVLTYMTRNTTFISCHRKLILLPILLLLNLVF